MKKTTTPTNKVKAIIVKPIVHAQVKRAAKKAGLTISEYTTKALKSFKKN